MSLPTDSPTDSPSDGTNQTTSDPGNPVTTRPRRWGITHILILGALIALAAFGILSRQATTRRLEQATLGSDTPVVSITLPQQAPAVVHIALPGETQAFTQSPIYAQANGYLKKWYFDIGAHVKSGETLADIDTPALDQQLAQAQATLKQAQAALWLSKSTYDRYAELLSKKVISAQDLDNKTGDYQENQAAVATDEANLRQIQALTAFKTVKAPFDGIVSARNTDIGSLISSNSATPLFTMARIDPLRVYVNIPQTLASSVKVGTKAEITFDTFPGRKFPAEVVSTAGAIDPTTRTLLTQLSLQNHDGELLPGSYATVNLELQSGVASLILPSNVLLFRSEGAAVGVVGADDKVEIRKIKIGRDLGNRLEIVDGLHLTDHVILNPSDSLANGEVVRIAGNLGDSARP
jgi:RND family efflux transporter MFP subunit